MYSLAIFQIHLGNVPSPTMYGPLSYGNYTVIVEAQSAISFEVITITHQGNTINACGSLLRMCA